MRRPFVRLLAAGTTLCLLSALCMADPPGGSLHKGPHGKMARGFPAGPRVGQPVMGPMPVSSQASPIGLERSAAGLQKAQEGLSRAGAGFSRTAPGVERAAGHLHRSMSSHSAMRAAGQPNGRRPDLGVAARPPRHTLGDAAARPGLGGHRFEKGGLEDVAVGGWPDDGSKVVPASGVQPARGRGTSASASAARLPASLPAAAAQPRRWFERFHFPSPFSWGRD